MHSRSFFMEVKRFRCDAVLGSAWPTAQRLQPSKDGIERQFDALGAERNADFLGETAVVLEGLLPARIDYPDMRHSERVVLGDLLQYIDGFVALGENLDDD